MIVAQIFAVIIFVGMFILIVLDKIERHYVTLGSGLLTLSGIVKKCAVGEYPKSWIGRSQAA